MLEQIKSAIFWKYKQDEVRWLFLSTFNDTNALISSNGSLEPDKVLNQLVELLYHGLLEKEKNLKVVVVDIVTESMQETNMQKLMQINPVERWFCLIAVDWSNTSWIILPNTQWVTDVKQALMLVKQKYNLSGNVAIYIFKTDRIVISF